MDWVFAVYRNIELISIYFIAPTDLEPLFNRWEKKWHDDGGGDINNPKFPLDFVVKHGRLLYGEVPILKGRPRGETVVTIAGTPVPAVEVVEDGAG